MNQSPTYKGRDTESTGKIFDKTLENIVSGEDFLNKN